jgi:gliding motility-associated protein GldL
MKGLRMDPFSFFYGIGAAILLSGLLLETIGHHLGETFFLVGMGAEIFIFFISAFEFRKKEKKYQWEKIFPELVEQAEGKGSEEARSVLEQYTKSAEVLKVSMENLKNITNELNDAYEYLHRFNKAMNVKGEVIHNEFEGIEEQLNMNKNRLNELDMNLRGITDVVGRMERKF